MSSEKSFFLSPVRGTKIFITFFHGLVTNSEAIVTLFSNGTLQILLTHINAIYLQNITEQNVKKMIRHFRTRLQFLKQ
jgi:hypothetical protein